MNDDDLREAVLEELRANRTTGAGGTPLKVSDANLATTLDCDLGQLNRVLALLIEEGTVHGKPRRVVSNGPQMEWDYLRLTDDPLPPLNSRELD